VRHFDYVWLRAKRPGITDATPPHYDVVYMGRGTKKLFTSWTPLEDVPMEKGGLMILEGSHRLEEVKSTYGELDVDTSDPVDERWIGEDPIAHGPEGKRGFIC
jgi:ectoine hydroxylase-related dioxygenase (phytanoyl-CoA dioxygenase family)